MVTRSSDRVRKLGQSMVVASLGLVLAFASACSSSSGGSKSASASSSSGSSSSGSSSSGGADLAAAQKLIAPYIGQPSPFPTLPTLTSKPASGSSFSYLQCSAASCAVFAPILKAASAALGVKLSVVAAGASASDVQSAMATIVSQKPTAVFIAGVDPTPITAQIKALVDSKVPVVGIGIVNPEQYGLSTAVNSNTAITLFGQLVAAYAITLHQDATNVAFYNTPEIAFSPVYLASFQKEMSTLCPKCPVRVVTLTLSNPSGAAATVVSDLQAHPQTNVGAFDLMQLAAGLPAALATAGLTKVDIIGQGPSAAQLAAVKGGQLNMGVGTSVPTIVWSAVDAAARLTTGQAVPSADTGVPPVQLLRQQDINFDPALPFSPYDDAGKFAAIWK